MSKAITIVVLTCFLVLGAATTAILGRDSVPSVSAEMITQAPPKPLATNRAAKADRLVPTLALASAAIEPQKSYSLLSDVQISGIKDRLKLSSSQEYYWPSVETALRNVVRRIQANKLSNPNAPPGAQIDPNCDEVQQLKSAAMPLLFQLRDDQKEEVRKLARIIGLEKVAQQI